MAGSGRPLSPSVRKRIWEFFDDGRYGLRTIAKLCRVGFSTVQRQQKLWREAREGDGNDTLAAV